MFFERDISACHDPRRGLSRTALGYGVDSVNVNVRVSRVYACFSPARGIERLFSCFALYGKWSLEDTALLLYCGFVRQEVGVQFYHRSAEMACSERE